MKKHFWVYERVFKQWAVDCERSFLRLHLTHFVTFTRYYGDSDEKQKKKSLVYLWDLNKALVANVIFILVNCNHISTTVIIFFCK